VNSTNTQDVIVTNPGATSVAFSAVTLPAAPFAVLGAPAVGQTIAGGASIAITVVFQPSAPGSFQDALTLTTASGTVSIPLAGVAALPSPLVIQPLDLNFGTVPLGATATFNFTLTNPGAIPTPITKSKPPAGAFVATTRLEENSFIPAMTTVTETVAFTPPGPGAFSDTWTINYVGSTQPVVVTMHGATGSGTGVTGQYFQGTTLAGPAIIQRVDHTIDFWWLANRPDPKVATPQFSVQWTGQIQAAYTEPYTFTTTSNNGGVRLWVNGTSLVDDWANHGYVLDRGTINLVAGQKYDLQMQYYCTATPAIIVLQWSSPSLPIQVVPTAFLFQGATPDAGM
jgi:hypothetical protein